MNKKPDKYSSDDSNFDDKHGVLKNKLGITNQEKLDYIENQELLKTWEKLSLEYSETHTFTIEDIRYLHKIFLGNVYAWAGDYRTVDISSVDIRWCHAAHIGSEMERLNGLLATLTPFAPELERAEVLERLAKIHGELVVIHPFRDGNGRVTRLLCDLLLMQAEINPIGQMQMDRDEYFIAIRSVWAKEDYAPLIRLFDRLLAK